MSRARGQRGYRTMSSRSRRRTGRCVRLPAAFGPPRGAPAAGAEGFSLVEMLVATFVTVLVAGALYTGLTSTQTFYENYASSMDRRQAARLTLDRMADELRLAGYDVGTAGEVLTAADDQVVQFVGDIDDGDPAGPCDATYEDAAGGGAERVKYEVDAVKGQLIRSVDCWTGAAWVEDVQTATILSGLDTKTAVFTYYDLTGTQIPLGGGTLDADARGDVRSVRILLSVLDDTRQVVGDQEYVTLQLETRVRLYNLESRDDR